MTSSDLDANGSRPRRVASIALLLAAIVLAYSPALTGGWLAEDWARVPRSASAAGAHEPEAPAFGPTEIATPELAPTGAQNAPLSRALLGATYRVAGFDPRAYRAVALAIHLLSACMVGCIAWQWLRDRRAQFVATALFALHPLQAPLVTTLASLDASMALCLALIALACHEASSGSTREGLLRACAVLTWILAIVCDRWAVVVPMFALVAELVRREPARARRLPLAIASGFALLLLFALPNPLERDPDIRIGAARRVLLRIEMLGGVVRDLAWPPAARLFTPFQPNLEATDRSLAGAWIALLALVVVALWAWKRRARASTAALCFLPIALVPALLDAERRLPFPISGAIYGAPMIGLALCAAAVANALPKGALISFVACALPLALGIATARRLPTWHDERVLYTRAVAESPDSPTLRWRLGRALLDAYRAHGARADLELAGGSFESALDQLAQIQHGDRSVFAKSDDFLQANLGLGWTLLHQDEADRFFDDETALSVFRTLTERYPQSSEAQVGYSVAASALGRADEAEQALQRALAIDSRRAETWHDLGLVRARRGDWKGAQQAFEEALRRRPDHVDDLLLLARAHVQANDVEGAKEPMAHAARIDPKNPGPLWLQATVAASHGDFDSALALVRQALDLAPNDGESWLLKGKIHLARSEENSAFTALQRAVDLLPRSFEASYNLAALLLKRGEIAAAVPLLEHAYGSRPTAQASADLRRTLLELDLHDPDLYARLAALDARRGQTENTEQWLARALALQPDHGPSHAVRGRMLWHADRKDEAIVELDQACRAMPSDFAVHFDLGTLLEERGRKAEAHTRYGEALSIATRDSSLEAQSAVRMLRDKLAEKP